MPMLADGVKDGAALMIYLVPIAVVGIVLLQASGAIPASSVGGPLTIALALFVGALAVGIHEAWTRRRGVLGWIVNLVVSLVGAFMIAPLGGMVMALALGPSMDGRGSLAATGGPVFSVALAGVMGVTLAGVWAALWVVNRWR